jgi:hypothetical protein
MRMSTPIFFVNDDGSWLTATSEFLLDRFNRCFKYIDWDFARGAGR